MCLYGISYVFICLYFACILRLVVLAAKNTSKIQAYEQIWHTYKHIQTQHMTPIQADIAVCICLYMLVCAYICWYLLVFDGKIFFSKKWHIGTYNSACICLYDVYMSYVSVFSTSFYVFACMCLYWYVGVCIHLYGHVSAWASLTSQSPCLLACARSIRSFNKKIKMFTAPTLPWPTGRRPYPHPLS